MSLSVRGCRLSTVPVPVLDFQFFDGPGSDHGYEDLKKTVFISVFGSDFFWNRRALTREDSMIQDEKYMTDKEERERKRKHHVGVYDEKRKEGTDKHIHDVYIPHVGERVEKKNQS